MCGGILLAVQSNRTMVQERQEIGKDLQHRCYDRICSLFGDHRMADVLPVSTELNPSAHLYCDCAILCSQLSGIYLPGMRHQARMSGRSNLNETDRKHQQEERLTSQFEAEG